MFTEFNAHPLSGWRTSPILNSNQLYLNETDATSYSNKRNNREDLPQIMQGRKAFKPFLYPQAYDMWLKQNQCHWLHTRINEMERDTSDWYQRLNDQERNLIGKLLKGFTQMEVEVGRYWGVQVPTWFPHPEIMMMGSTFAAMEGIHAISYNRLSDVLDLQDHDVFLEQSAASEKLELLGRVSNTNSPKDIARNLALYSGLAEGVSLFSSFGVLIHFAARGVLTKMGTIISYSIRDESLHSSGGCYLFNQLVSEAFGKMPSDLCEEVRHAAFEMVRLENNFVDMMFEGHAVNSNIVDIDPRDLKDFISYRAEMKLNELNCGEDKVGKLFTYDTNRAEKIAEIFATTSGGAIDTDFFAAPETGYSIGVTDFSAVDLDCL